MVEVVAGGMCTNLSCPTMKQAKELGAITFEGTTNPLAAWAWSSMFEKILEESMQCLNEDEVMIASFLLEGNACTWQVGPQVIWDYT